MILAMHLYPQQQQPQQEQTLSLIWNRVSIYSSLGKRQFHDVAVSCCESG